MDRQKMYVDYLYRWIKLGQVGIRIEHLLSKRNIEKVAIYGFDKIAKCLVYELENSSIQIQAIIDKRGEQIEICNKPIYSLDNIAEVEADAIILCPVAPYELVKRELEMHTDIKIITFEEVIYEL